MINLKILIKIIVLAFFFTINVILIVNGEVLPYIVVGDTDYPPYEYIDEYGNYRGFNVDIINAIALAEGIDLKFEPMVWDKAYEALENRDVDIVQGMSVTPSRENKFLFTQSYLNNTHSLFILNENKEIKGVTTLKGKNVGVQIKDTGDEISKEMDDVFIYKYKTQNKALQALLNKEIDVFIGNTLTLSNLINKQNLDDKIKIVGKVVSKNKYAIAVKDKELLFILNRGIGKIQENGMYDSIYRKWFGAPLNDDYKTIQIVRTLSMLLLIIVVILVIFIYVYKKINKELKKQVQIKTNEQSKLLEEVSRKDKIDFIEKVVSSLAHEIRNPLTSIKIYAELIPKHINDEDFQKSIAIDIPNEIERINSLIKEFIDFTSPKYPEKKEIYLKEEIVKSIRLIKGQLNDIDTIIEIDENEKILFDKNHLNQILINIILNSKYALEKELSPRINIFTKKDSKYIYLNICDNGIGVNKDDMKKLFDPFYTTKETGTGLGLFVVKKLAEENNCEISAFSKNNKGLDIIIRIEKII